jgi:hypothetical protein
MNQDEGGITRTAFDHASLTVLDDMVFFENYGIIDFYHIKPTGQKPTIELTVNIMQRFIVTASLETIRIPNSRYNFCSCQTLAQSDCLSRSARSKNQNAEQSDSEILHNLLPWN